MLFTSPVSVFNYSFKAASQNWLLVTKQHPSLPVLMSGTLTEQSWMNRDWKTSSCLTVTVGWSLQKCTTDTSSTDKIIPTTWRMTRWHELYIAHKGIFAPKHTHTHTHTHTLNSIWNKASLHNFSWLQNTSRGLQITWLDLTTSTIENLSFKEFSGSFNIPKPYNYLFLCLCPWLSNKRPLGACSGSVLMELKPGVPPQIPRKPPLI